MLGRAYGIHTQSRCVMTLHPEQIIKIFLRQKIGKWPYDFLSNNIKHNLSQKGCKINDEVIQFGFLGITVNCWACRCSSMGYCCLEKNVQSTWAKQKMSLGKSYVILKMRQIHCWLQWITIYSLFWLVVLEGWWWDWGGMMGTGPWWSGGMRLDGGEGCPVAS